MMWICRRKVEVRFPPAGDELDGEISVSDGPVSTRAKRARI